MLNNTRRIGASNHISTTNKSWKYFACIPIIETKLMYLFLVYIGGDFWRKVRWRKSTILEFIVCISDLLKYLNIMTKLFKCMSRAFQRCNVSIWASKGKHHRRKAIGRTDFKNIFYSSGGKCINQKRRCVPRNIGDVSFLSHFSHFFEKKGHIMRQLRKDFLFWVNQSHDIMLGICKKGQILLR